MSLAQHHQAPVQTPRLLAGVMETGGRAGFAEHQGRYGALPDGKVRRGGEHELLTLVEESGLLGARGSRVPHRPQDAHGGLSR